jgi:DNA-binding NarL/FixJ family response regulator
MAISVRIAVSDPLPVFRRGVMAALGGSGLEVDTPEDLLSWIREEQRRVVFLTLQAASDWSLLAELRMHYADVIVVALLDDTTVRTYVQAILAGAATVIPREASPEVVRQVLEAAVAGKSFLPLEVVRALASPEKLPEGDEEMPPARAIEWLRELAQGVTVAELAGRAGYSERAMYRHLRELYARVGARNRTEALMRAHERGWL